MPGVPIDLRFDQFVDGENIQPGDIVVGLRTGLNTYFNAGTIASQNANAVAITGGSIGNTNIEDSDIGQTTPALGSFTTATAGTLQSGNAQITGGDVSGTTLTTCSLLDSIIDNTAVGVTVPRSGHFTVLDATTFTAASVTINGGEIDGVNINNSTIGNITPSNAIFTNAQMQNLLTETISLPAELTMSTTLAAGDVVTVAGYDSFSGYPTVTKFANPGIDPPRGISLAAHAPGTLANFLYRGTTFVDLGVSISTFPTTLYVQSTGTLGTALTATRAGVATSLITGTTYSVDLDFDTLSSESGVNTVQVISSSTYTLAATDNGTILLFTYSGDVTVTLPNDATLDLPAGFNCVAISQNTAPYGINFVVQGSDSLRGSGRIVSNQSGTLQKTTDGASGVWRVNVGDIQGAYELPASGTLTLTEPWYAAYYYQTGGDLDVTIPDLTGLQAPEQGKPIYFKNESDSILTLIYASTTRIMQIPPGAGAWLVPVGGAGLAEVALVPSPGNQYMSGRNTSGTSISRGTVLTSNNGYYTSGSTKIPTIQTLGTPGVQVPLGILLNSTVANNTTTDCILRYGNTTLSLISPSYTAGTLIYVDTFGQLTTTQTAQLAGVIIENQGSAQYRCFIDFDSPVNTYAYFTAGTITGLTDLNSDKARIGASNTITSSSGGLIGGGGCSIISSPKSFVSGAANMITNGDSCAIVGGLNNSITSGATNATILSGLAATIDDSNNALIIGGSGTHSITRADSAIAGGFGSCTVTHGAGFTYSAVLGGTLSSRANFQWLTECSGGYIFLGPNASITMKTVIADGSMDNSTYHLYTSTTGPVVKFKDVSGNIGRWYSSPIVPAWTNNSAATSPLILTNPLNYVYNVGFAAPGGVVRLPAANSYNSPLGVMFVLVNANSNTFALQDASTAVQANIQPNQTYLVILVDNSTSAGTWFVIPFGTMAYQMANAVAITGGTIAGVTFTSATINSGAINNTTIGQTTPLAGTFTTLAGESLSIVKSSSASNVDGLVSNTSNTANSGARVMSSVAGSSAASAIFQSIISGVQTWTWGAHNPTTGDPWVLSAGATLGTNNAIIVQTSGELSFPLQSLFSAFLSATTGGVTGAGTVYTVICNTEIADQNSDYNNSTGTYTSSFTGPINFTASVAMGALVAANTTGYLQLTTSNRTYRTSDINIGAVRTAGNFCTLLLDITADMDAGDTATLQVVVTGGAGNIATVSGGGSPVFTIFMGTKVA